MTRIAVLTGGGDCPGLNAAIRAVARSSHARGSEVLGVRNGWRGLVEGGLEPLPRERTTGIIARGGTILGSSGADPWRMEAGVERLVEHADGLDGIVAIGGEGTLGIAARLHAEHGLPVVGLPKTIDNDLAGTDTTVGFDTAVAVATEAIDRVHTTAESHNRVMVVEVMGRHTGWIAVEAGIAAGADVVLIPEFPLTVDEVCTLVRKRQAGGRSYSIVVVAEGWPITLATGGPQHVITGTDPNGYVRFGGVGAILATEVEARTGFESRVTVLGHVQRGGTPTARDRTLATRLGLLAAELVHEERFGLATVVRGDDVIAVQLADTLGERKCVPAERYRAAQAFFG